MADDVYEPVVTTKDQTLSTPWGDIPMPVATVAQVDLSVLGPKLAPHLSNQGDNVFTSTNLTDSRPDPAPPTKGPHRYTIFVPADDGARVNIGAGLDMAPPGVSIDTKTHVHLYAYGTVPTFMNLGSQPLSFLPHDVGGYHLFTEGYSAHNAKLQVELGSQTEGVAISGKTVVLISAGDQDVALEAGSGITLNGKKKVAITAGVAESVNAGVLDVIGAIALTAVDVADFGAGAALAVKGGDAEQKGNAAVSTANFLGGFAWENANKLRDQWVAAASGHIDKALGHIATVVGLVLSFKKTWKTPKPGSSAWEVKGAKIAYALGVASEIKAIYTDYIKGKDPEEPGGITMNAESSVSIDAKGSVGINGVKGVAITGFKGAAMSGLTASMKGHKEATVWGGLGASMKALAGDVAISSDLKGATVKGKKDVEMSSEAGKATFTGDDDAQLNSVKKKTFVHGRLGVYLGCGMGDGVGVVGGDTKLAVGCVSSADTFASAKGNEGKPLLRFDEKVAQLTHTADSKVLVSKNTVGLTSKEVKITGKTKILMKGKIIELN